MSISRRILRLFASSRPQVICLLSNLNRFSVQPVRWFSPNKDPSNEPKQFYRRPLPASCIAFASSEGRQIFKEALEMGFLESFYDLVPQFRTQAKNYFERVRTGIMGVHAVATLLVCSTATDDLLILVNTKGGQAQPSYCGFSAMVMVLNSFELDPGRVWKAPWRWYHEDMLTCCLVAEDSFTDGITIDQFQSIAKCHGLNVDLHQPNCPTETIDIFRSRILSLCSQSLSTSGTILVVAYDRKAVNQTGSGHYTLVGGYHPKRDLILVLETAAFKYPMHWAPLTSIYNGICSLDKITGRPRGYMLITRAFDPRIGLIQISSSTQDSQDTGEAFEEYRTARETFISSSEFANVNRLTLFCFADAAFQAFFSPSTFLDPDSAGGRLRKVAEEWCSYLLITPQNSLGKTCCCLLQPSRGSEHGKDHQTGPAHCSPILSPSSPPQSGRGQRCDCPCLVDNLLDKLLSLLITYRPPGFFFGCQPLWPDSSANAASTIEVATQIIFELVSSATGRRARLALERLPQRSYEWLTTDVCGPLTYRFASSLNLGYGRPSFGVNSSGSTPSPLRSACAIPLVTDPKIRATTLLTAFLLAFPYHTISKPQVTLENVKIGATNTSTLIERLDSSEHLLNDLPNLSEQTCFTVLTPGTRSELTSLSNILSQLVTIRRPLGTRCMEGKKDNH